VLTSPETAPPPARSQHELVEEGIELVRRIAFRMARRLPPRVDVDDLIGAGNEGLLKALAGYDADKHPRFAAYAEHRIRGAILDELRGWDAMTRHGRKRLLQVSKAIAALQAELGRQPEEDEIADRLGMDLEDYHRLAMELARGPALGRIGEIDPDHVDSGFDDPLTLLGEAELKTRLARAITKLPQRTQQVLALYYQQECTQAEIGQILDVTESRICQILGEAAARLRALLNREENLHAVPLPGRRRA
jgi:RNA polymerase sigma factor for flagellar operon FliA